MIFGQDKASRRQFREDFGNSSKGSASKSPLVARLCNWSTERRRKGGNSIDTQGGRDLSSRIQPHDPLLRRLCEKKWSKQDVYDDLGIAYVRSNYSASIDFPVFKGRLKDLHDYVLCQSPSGWMSLWKDRRDLAKFWTLVSVGIFGFATLVIGVVQILLAAYQIASDKQKPDK